MDLRPALVMLTILTNIIMDKKKITHRSVSPAYMSTDNNSFQYTFDNRHQKKKNTKITILLFRNWIKLTICRF